VNNVAAARAREAGLTVVMDRCMRKEHVQLRGSTSGKSPITQAI
jgi:predicted CoA-binding protein